MVAFWKYYFHEIHLEYSIVTSLCYEKSEKSIAIRNYWTWNNIEKRLKTKCYIEQKIHSLFLKQVDGKNPCLKIIYQQFTNQMMQNI